jgi:hypothetical protein
VTDDESLSAAALIRYKFMVSFSNLRSPRSAVLKTGPGQHRRATASTQVELSAGEQYKTGANYKIGIR